MTGDGIEVYDPGNGAGGSAASVNMLEMAVGHDFAAPVTTSVHTFLATTRIRKVSVVVTTPYSAGVSGVVALPIASNVATSAGGDFNLQAVGVYEIPLYERTAAGDQVQCTLTGLAADSVGACLVIVDYCDSPTS